MKPDLEYTFPIPEAFNQLIINIVTQAEKDGECVCFYNPVMGGTFYTVGTKEIPANTLLAHSLFLRLGFLSPVEDPTKSYPTQFIIEEKAFKWVRYSKSSCFVKCVIRNFNNFKDILLAISFGLSVWLTILQIIQAIKQ